MWSNYKYGQFISELVIFISFVCNIRWMEKEFSVINTKLKENEETDYAEYFFKRTISFLWKVLRESALVWLIDHRSLSLILALGVPCVTVFIIASTFITAPHEKQLQKMFVEIAKKEICEIIENSNDKRKNCINESGIKLKIQCLENKSIEGKCFDLECNQAEINIKDINGDNEDSKLFKCRLIDGYLEIGYTPLYEWEKMFRCIVEKRKCFDIVLQLKFKLTNFDCKVDSYPCVLSFSHEDIV